MPEQPELFGQQLRRCRIDAGLTLTGLGALVHYSKGYLSKVECGSKRPTPQLARLCDTALNAGGTLSALVTDRRADTALPESSQDGEVWSMYLDKDGSGWFQPVSRRQAMATGAASALALGLEGLAPWADGQGGGLVDACRSLFLHFRRLGQVSEPATLLPAMIAQTHSLEQLAHRCGPRTRHDLLALAARYAEYVGWMAQESGNDVASLWWTDRAVTLADAVDDHGLVAYALVRRALVSLLRGEPGQAVDLTGQALDSATPQRVRGLAAQHRAQAYAALGDYDGTMRALDLARDLLASDPGDPDTPIIGTSQLADPVSMYTGWCLHDLGRPRIAVDVLRRELAHVPAQAIRTRSRHGVRLALAHASAGDIDQACAVADELLGSVALLRSATIRADLRQLDRVLRRHPRSAAVRTLTSRLTSTLTASA